jgi:hypothetical protein
MSSTWAELTSGGWRCMCCGEERPYDCIDVAYRPLSGMEDRFPDTRVNVSHCNDRPECTARALDPGPWIFGRGVSQSQDVGASGQDDTERTGDPDDRPRREPGSR